MKKLFLPLLISSFLLIYSGSNAQTTFNYTGAVQKYVIPTCVASVTIEAWGSEGDSVIEQYSPFVVLGGKGGYAKGTLSVAPGDTLYVYVGGMNKWNGGGTGGYGTPSTGQGGFAGDGGDASDVRHNAQGLANRVIVAGGGGGGGRHYVNGSCVPCGVGGPGGAGGALIGLNGTDGCCNGYPNPGSGGIGGNQSSGGAGGTTTGGPPGTAGVLWKGGDGPNGNYDVAGAGAGGGYYGGGGGAGAASGNGKAGGGGAGGSSYVGTLTATTTTAGVKKGLGRVIITQNGGVSVTATQSAICSGSSTTITAAGGVNYSWNPGGATTPAITVSPTVTTTYTITTTGGSCNGTNAITITVNQYPTITATASQTSNVCTGTGVTLTGTGATSYTWNPGSATGSSVVVNPTGTTTYTLSGTSNGCTSTKTVTISTIPSPTVTVTGGTTVCAGDSATISASGASTYTWQPGSMTGSSVVVTPGSSTTYTVTATATNGCTATGTVTVNTTPKPIVNVVGLQVICQGKSSTLTASGAQSYSWSTGATTQSIIVTPTVTTSYTVTGSVGSCKNTNTVTVTVNPAPVLTTTGNLNVCLGDSTTLTVSGATNYVWSPGSYTTSSITIMPTTATTYTVTGNNGSCVGSLTLGITVAPKPVVSVSGSGTSVCSGTSVTLTGAGNPTSWSWNPGGQTSSSVTVSPTITTIYTVTGTIGSCTQTATIQVGINSSPVANPGPNQTICINSSTQLFGTGGVAYSWSPSTGLSCTTCQVPTANPTITTTYTLQVTSSNSCTNTAAVTVTVISCVGIEENSLVNNFNIYPNPNTGLFTIEADFKSNSQVNIQLSNMLGETVQSIENDMLTGSYRKEVNIQDLPKGIYFLIIRGDKSQIIKKVIKD